MFEKILNIEVLKIFDFSGSTFQAGDANKQQLKDKSTQGLVSRFVAIFQNHGVSRHQIPRMLPEFKLSPGDLDNDAELARRLSPELQDAACRLFNVRPQWLLNGDGGRLNTVFLHRGLDSWIETLERAIEKDSWPELIVCRTENVELDEFCGQGAALVLCWRVGEIADHRIWAYQPVYSIREWRDNGSRFLATRAMVAADRLNVRLTGLIVSADDINPLAEGAQWPEVIFEKVIFPGWHPEDYTFGPTSRNAKGLETLKWVQSECDRDGSTALLESACAKVEARRLDRDLQQPGTSIVCG
jgi:hypothetical protein